MGPLPRRCRAPGMSLSLTLTLTLTCRAPGMSLSDLPCGSLAGGGGACPRLSLPSNRAVACSLTSKNRPDTAS
jgi:hypothetical protein